MINDLYIFMFGRNLGLNGSIITKNQASTIVSLILTAYRLTIWLSYGEVGDRTPRYGKIVVKKRSLKFLSFNFKTL